MKSTLWDGAIRVNMDEAFTIQLKLRADVSVKIYSLTSRTVSQVQYMLYALRICDIMYPFNPCEE